MALSALTTSLEPLTRLIPPEAISLLSKITIATGSLTLASVFYKTLRSIYSRFRPSRITRYQHSPSFDTASSDPRAWALVTGASDGLGFGFCDVLAARNFNIVLHGRNETKLKKAAETIESRHKVSTRLLVLDAAKYPHFAEEYARFDETVLAGLSDLNLTVLVNNVGGVSTLGLKFNKLDHNLPENMDDIINVNARFPMQLTRVVTPLLERNQPGLILNISSGAALTPAPWQIAYSSSKAFIGRFSSGLKAEFLAYNNDVESLAFEVMLTATPGTGRGEKDASFLVPSAKTVAESTVELVGCGYPNATPYLPHAMQLVVFLFVAGYSHRWLENQAIKMFGAAKRENDKRVEEAKAVEEKSSK